MSNTSPWRAGAAELDITPTDSMWLAGWAARREPASGAATPLFAKAMSIQFEDDTPLLIITVDLINVTREIVVPVAADIHSRLGIPRERILFNASHTHTAPEVRPEKAPFFAIPDDFAAKIPAYVEHLKHQLVEVAVRANSIRPTGHLLPGVGTATFALNRRKPPGPADHRVISLHTPAGVIFGYACHCLTLPYQFVQYCAEYAGFASRELHARVGPPVAMYLSGASADVNPHPSGSVELAKQHGAELAQAVNAAFIEAVKSSRLASGPLRAAFREVELEFQPIPTPEQLESDAAQTDDPPRQFKAGWMLEQLAAGHEFPRTYPCPVQVISFGPELLIIALGGEPVAQYALDFQAEFGRNGGRIVWVCGYSNDGFGYLPTEAVQREGGYEAGRAALWSNFPGPFTLNTERRIKTAVRELVKSIE